MFLTHLYNSSLLENRAKNETGQEISEATWCYLRDFYYTLNYISPSFIDDGTCLPRGFLATSSQPIRVGMFDKYVFSGLASATISTLPCLDESFQHVIPTLGSVPYATCADWLPCLTDGWAGVYESDDGWCICIYSRLPSSMMDDFEKDCHDVDKYRNLSIENRRRLMNIALDYFNITASTYSDVLLDDILVEDNVTRRMSSINTHGVTVCQNTGTVLQNNSASVGWTSSFGSVVDGRQMLPGGVFSKRSKESRIKF